MNALDGSHKKSIGSEVVNYSPTDRTLSAQSMTGLKHKRNTGVARARAGEMIEIYGFEALNLGVDAVVDHLLQGQRFPVDFNSLPGNT